MPNNYPVISFNAGRLSKKIDARSDIDKYKYGCRELDNFIPLIYGPAERRPGTKYIDTSAAGARVIPFVYSSSVAYMILLENIAMYFYYAGARVLNGATRVTTVTPYLTAHLPALQYKQNNDLMWITHGSYAPYKLSRTSATAFSLAKIVFKFGPFMKRNDLANDDDVTITPSVLTGSGTLASSSAVFQAGHVGALFTVFQPRVNTVVTGSKASPATGVVGSSILVEGSFTFTTGGTWEGTVVLERSIDNSTWEQYRTWTNQAQFTGTEDENDVYYRINVSAMTSGTIKTTLTVNSSVQQGIAKITAFTNTKLVSMTVQKAFASTNADVRWAEGSWSDVRGYPKCMTFFENRAVFAGSTAEPQTIWLSATDDYEYFFKGTLGDSSFSVTMNSEQRNAIQWIASLEALLQGTSAGKWRLRSSSFDEAIKPDNFSIKQQDTRGSKAIQALQVNDVILFVDPVGRKLRELTLDGGKDKYVAPDLTSLAEDITESGIVAIAHQKNPDSIVWAVTADGGLKSMVYEREQQVVAWSQHPMSD